MNVPAPQILIRDIWCALPGFHRLMAFACISIIAISFIGCRLTLIRMPDASAIAIGAMVLIPVILLLPAYWNEKGKIELRDAALTIPWCLIFRLTLPNTVGIAGRLGMSTGLQDGYFAHLDQSLGVSVPSILAWSSQHWFGNFVSSTYPLLTPLLQISFFLPALTGKVKQAQQFITSNLIAFAVGMPLFTFFPAVGPWYGYHLAANPGQVACQQSLFQLRTPGPYNLQDLGVVCFPSFHVIWVLLCVNALWCFKFLRIPMVILAGLIILSTLTGGWHYFVDVLAGFLVGAVAIAASRGLTRSHNP